MLNGIFLHSKITEKNIIITCLLSHKIAIIWWMLNETERNRIKDF